MNIDKLPIDMEILQKRKEIKDPGEDFNQSIFGLVEYTDRKGEKRTSITVLHEKLCTALLKE